MTEARLPMYHRTTIAVAAFDRLARAAGNTVDSAKLGREDLFFLADLPLTEDERHFVDGQISPLDRVRLNALVDRCTRPCAEFLSAVAPTASAGIPSPVPTAVRTRAAA